MCVCLQGFRYAPSFGKPPCQLPDVVTRLCLHGLIYLGVSSSERSTPRRRLSMCRMLFGELQLGQHLQLLRRVFLGGAGDFLDAFASRLMAAAGPGSLTAAAAGAALEDAFQVSC